MVDYARDFPAVSELMPTIQGNVEMLGAPHGAALIAQAIVCVPVFYVVWNAFRAGATPRAMAVLVVGVFLATPHAFNYDMPMMTAAIVWYVEARYKASRSLDVGELVAVLLAALLPFIMINLRGTGMAFSYAPLLMMLMLIARPDAALSERVRPLAAE